MLALRITQELPHTCKTLCLYSRNHFLRPVSTAVSEVRGMKRRGGKDSVRSKPLIHKLPKNIVDPPSKFDSQSKLFKPVTVLPNADNSNLGREIAGDVDRSELLKLLKTFFDDKTIKTLSKEQGLDDYLYWQACVSFRKFCMDDTSLLPPELYVLFSDVLQNAANQSDIFPYFMAHARKVFPHLECLDELKLISDLTNPPNWYPEARSINRKIIFHAGPTNSGKTYNALKRFTNAKSGVYCGPLKMLAVEVFNKTNALGTPCDLVTGEERKFADPEETPSSHVACTVEMTSVNQFYEVAVIDEIQMVKDYQRGWAWTRALIGLAAEEIHVCGERAAIDLVREVCFTTGEELEVIEHERKTKLIQEDDAVGSLENVTAGDCIVCFSKQDIYAVSRGLEKLGKSSAVIYGSLPPTTKLAMAEKFNDPMDPCKILVATDAIGMGLNLNIRRIVFFSMSKIHLLEDGSKEMTTISVSQALQIAGRAGRFGTQWETGYVTCFNQEDMHTMKELLAQNPPDILTAGLHPTFDQIEMYAYHLPHASLANLVDIFASLSAVDGNLYSLCKMLDFKFLADMIEHIRLPLKAKYTFCCAPINQRMPLVCTMFMKIIRQYSRGSLITFDWLCHQMGWPFSPPETILDLVNLEAVHDVFDLYLWLSYRFPVSFSVMTAWLFCRLTLEAMSLTIPPMWNTVVRFMPSSIGKGGRVCRRVSGTSGCQKSISMTSLMVSPFCHTSCSKLSSMMNILPSDQRAVSLAIRILTFPFVGITSPKWALRRVFVGPECGKTWLSGCITLNLI